MLKKDFANGIQGSANVETRPMRKDDAYAMIGITGMAIGQNIEATRRQFESYIGNGFVAHDPAGNLAGYIIGERHPKEFPNGIGVTNLIVDSTRADGNACADSLVSAMAHHCMAQGQRALDLVVFNNDANCAGICNRYAARLYDSRKGTGNDGNGFTADFYTIDDLPGKFGSRNPAGPKPRP